MDFSEVEEARALLSQHLPVTRLLPASSLSRRSGAEVYLKLESELPTGSFKVRGALNALQRRSQRGALSSVVASSTGNHGAAVAYAARKFGVAATVFLPENPNPIKRQRIAQLGARIVESGGDYDATREQAATFARQEKAYFVEDGRDPNLTPGPATIGWEILEQLPDAEVIYVPVGDTTLIRGLAFAAKHLNPKVRMVGVQAERAPAYYLSWKQNRALATEACDTLADGLAVRSASEDNVRELCRLVEAMELVSEEALLRAVYLLVLEEHTVAEPAAAATTAAFLKDAAARKGQRVVLLVTGANITAELLRRAVQTAS